MDFFTEAVRLDLVNDPLGFVHWAYPWGVSGTLLAQEDGPDVWQRDQLSTLRDRLVDPAQEGAIQLAIASGHGIGKGALTSWVVQWFISTRPFPQIVVTANTAAQLQGKTWRELAKWHQLFIGQQLFEWTATRYYLKHYQQTWFAQAIPWSERNPEAFAGTHEKHVLLWFDEASAIADVIFETAEGALTTTGAIWGLTGNPTRNTGRFRECFPGGKFAHRWHTRNIDSRTAKMADKKQLQQWVDDYGEDSDFVRVRVKGEFPRAASNQFIDGETVDKAMRHEAAGFESFPLILSVDVARFGDNKTVISIRQGRKLHEQRKFYGIDTMRTVAEVVKAYREAQEFYHAPVAAIYVEETGIGGAVVDRLQDLRYTVIAFNPAGTAYDDRAYHNRRAEVWGLMRKWLRTADIPNDPELKRALIGIEYGFDNKARVQLESKEDMKKRNLDSPDEGDSLAISFAEEIADDWTPPRQRREEEVVLASEHVPEEADYPLRGEELTQADLSYHTEETW